LRLVQGEKKATLVEGGLDLRSAGYQSQQHFPQRGPASQPQAQQHFESSQQQLSVIDTPFAFGT